MRMLWIICAAVVAVLPATAFAQPAGDDAPFPGFSLETVNQAMAPADVTARQIAPVDGNPVLQFTFNQLIYHMQLRDCAGGAVCEGALIYASYPLGEGADLAAVGLCVNGFSRSNMFLKAYLLDSGRIIGTRFANAAGGVRMATVRREFSLFGEEFVKVVRQCAPPPDDAAP